MTFNVQNFFTSVIANIVFGEPAQITVDSNWLQAETTASQELINAFSTYSFGSDAAGGANNLLNNADQNAMETRLRDIVAEGKNGQGDLGNFMTTYFTSAYLYEMSLAFLVTVQTAVTQCWNDPTTGGTQNSTVGTFQGLVTTTSQNAEQGGNNQISAMKSEMTQDGNMGQPFVDGVDAVIQTGTNIAGILNNPY